MMGVNEFVNLRTPPLCKLSLSLSHTHTHTHSTTYRTLRTSVIDLVLATDMAKHFEHLSKFSMSVVSAVSKMLPYVHLNSEKQVISFMLSLCYSLPPLPSPSLPFPLLFLLHSLTPSPFHLSSPAGWPWYKLFDKPERQGEPWESHGDEEDSCEMCRCLKSMPAGDVVQKMGGESSTGIFLPGVHLCVL